MSVGKHRRSPGSVGVPRTSEILGLTMRGTATPLIGVTGRAGIKEREDACDLREAFGVPSPGC